MPPFVVMVGDGSHLILPLALLQSCLCGPIYLNNVLVLPSLQPLCSHPIVHHISLYADDVVLFIRPTSEDLSTNKAILQLFGDASGLQTNVAKSALWSQYGARVMSS